jgi:hypothetical protein
MGKLLPLNLACQTIQAIRISRFNKNAGFEGKHLPQFPTRGKQLPF